MTGLRNLILAAALILAAKGNGQDVRSPFVLPMRAKLVEAAADGGGWRAKGEIAVSFEQAKAQLAAKIAADGWTHVHTISLGKGRILEAWSRGGEELTLMVWRIAPGRSGFSYGLDSKTEVSRKRGGK